MHTKIRNQSHGQKLAIVKTFLLAWADNKYLTNVDEAVVVRFEYVGVIRLSAESLLHQSQNLLDDAVVGVVCGDHLDVPVHRALRLDGLVHLAAAIEADEEEDLAALLFGAEVTPGVADGVAVGIVSGGAENELRITYKLIIES